MLTALQRGCLGCPLPLSSLLSTLCSDVSVETVWVTSLSLSCAGGKVIVQISQARGPAGD